MAWSKSTRISIMLAIDAAFFVLELGVGLVVGSLALMADAFHMVSTIQNRLSGKQLIALHGRSFRDGACI